MRERSRFVPDDSDSPFISPVPQPILGRGASANVPNRFERLHVELEPDDSWVDPEEEPIPLTTKFYRDHTRTFIARNNSPDVGFETSVNPVPRM